MRKFFEKVATQIPNFDTKNYYFVRNYCVHVKSMQIF